MRVGVAGLGRMGSAIAARLMEVGHQITAWNRFAISFRSEVGSYQPAQGHATAVTA